MNNYQNVDVDKLANIYFGGKVISRNIFLKDGSKKTLDMILEGKYELNLRQESSLRSILEN